MPASIFHASVFSLLSSSAIIISRDLHLWPQLKADDVMVLDVPAKLKQPRFIGASSILRNWLECGILFMV